MHFFVQQLLKLDSILCATAPETRWHFINECLRGSKQSERQIYIENLHKSPTLQNLPDSQIQIQNPEFLTHLTQDVSIVLEKETIESNTIDYRYLEFTGLTETLRDIRTSTNQG